jgi:hypothetical protein
MRKTLLLAVFAAMLCRPLTAGVVYEIEVKNHEQSPPKTESIEATVEGRHLRIGIAPGKHGGRGEMIFRGDRREMVVLDHENRSYHVLDQAAMDGIATQLGGVMSQMQQALQNVPPEQRAMMEQMMKQNMPQVPPTPSPIELQRTGEKATHNGYPCVKYIVRRGEAVIQELWVTDWSNLEGGKDAAGTFEEMAEFFRGMLDAIPDFGQGPTGGDTVFKHMKDLGGFPVVARAFGEDGSLESETTLRSARRQSLDADAFAPPSGYKRQEMFGGR